MTDQSDTPSAEVDLVSAYRSAVRQRKLVRVTLACIILVIVVVYISLMWITVVDFGKNGLPLVEHQLNEEIRNYLPIASQQLSEAANRVVPVYTKALTDTFQRDQELYAKTLLDEFDKLGEFAVSRTPMVEDAIAQLVLDQEKSASAAMQEILTEDQFAEISLAYDDALRQQLEVVMDKHFREHIQVGEEILLKLQTIADAEQGKTPMDNQVILGMMVELLGLDMQLAGEPLATTIVEEETSK
ncbi:MAG: hypothetical protein SFY80_14870 [Verrucomicrobiota bacterium]|nr:hypothetical protein [Verrucomicrobiota bacterium]